MSILPKQSVRFAFGAARQDAGDRHMRIGDLLTAINVRQTDSGPYTKRPGYTRQVVNFQGLPALPPTEDSLLPGDGRNLLMRDGLDRYWAFDADSPQWFERGTVRRYMPRHLVSMGGAVPDATGGALAPKTVAVEALGNTWTFALSLDTTPSTGSLGIRWMIRDTTSGIGKLQTTGFVINNSARHIAAVFDGASFIWVFSVNLALNLVTVHRFDAVNLALAPVTFVYYTGVATDVYYTVDAHRLTTAGEIAVVLTGRNSATGNSIAVLSYLNTATGLAKTSPAPATIITSTSFSDPDHSGASILTQQTGAGGVWYFSAFAGTNLTTSQVVLYTVINTTLAVSSIILGTMTHPAVPVGGNAFGITMGYLATNGDRVVYAQVISAPSSPTSTNPTRTDTVTITRFTFNGSTTATSVVARGAWIASKPIALGSTVYFISGFDDVRVPSTLPVAAGTGGQIQRSLHLRDSDGVLLAQIAYGEVSAAYHNKISDINLALIDHKADVFVTPLISSGTQLIFAMALAETANVILPGLVTIETAEAFGKAVQMGERAYAPGGIPVVWSKLDGAHELSPLVFPHYIRRFSGTGVGVTQVAALYRITDSDGSIWRSSPVIAGGGTVVFGPGDTLEVPTLRHRLPNTRVQIEIYAVPVGGSTLQLQGMVENDPSTDSTTFLMATVFSGTEVLYTTGGALSNAPAPPAKSLAAWRNRLFLSNGNDLYYSQETNRTTPPVFNEILKTAVFDGRGEILLLGVVDWNYLAMFKSDAITVISGPGPDGRGSGNYITQKTNNNMGCVAAGSIVTGPAGCYFQDATTGRVACVLTSLQSVEVAGGFQDAATANTVVAAIHVEKERQMQFFVTVAGAARVLVLDYRHLADVSTYGLCFEWEGGLSPAFAACVDAIGPVHLEANGVLRRPGTAFVDQTGTVDEQYEMSLSLGRVQPDMLQGEFSVSRVQVLGTFKAAHTINLATSPDGGPFTTVSKAITAAPVQIATRPPGCGRINDLRVNVSESLSSGAGFDFEGLAVEFQIKGRAKVLNTNQMG